MFPGGHHQHLRAEDSVSSPVPSAGLCWPCTHLALPHSSLASQVGKLRQAGPPQGPYRCSVRADAWLSSLLAMKFLISEKYESSFSSSRAWLSDSEVGEEALVPRWFVSAPECWLTADGGEASGGVRSRGRRPGAGPQEARALFGDTHSFPYRQRTDPSRPVPGGVPTARAAPSPPSWGRPHLAHSRVRVS